MALAPGASKLLGGGPLRCLAEFLPLSDLVLLRATSVAQRSGTERLLYPGSFRDKGGGSFALWAAHFADAIPEACEEAARCCAGSSTRRQLTIQLERGEHAPGGALDALLGEEGAGRRLFVGEAAARVLIGLLGGDPWQVYSALRFRGRSTCDPARTSPPEVVAFERRLGLVAWSLSPRMYRWMDEYHAARQILLQMSCMHLAVYDYHRHGPGANTFALLHVGASEQSLQLEEKLPMTTELAEGLMESLYPECLMESLRKLWSDVLIGCSDTPVRTLGEPFLHDRRCRCQRLILTAYELDLLEANEPVCDTCRHHISFWEIGEAAAEARKQRKKEEAKQQQNQKPRHHRGSSAKPYSQKRK